MILNAVLALILYYFAEFGSFWAHYVTMVEDTVMLSATKCSPKNLVVSDVLFIAIFAGDHPQRGP